VFEAIDKRGEMEGEEWKRQMRRQNVPGRVVAQGSRGLAGNGWHGRFRSVLRTVEYLCNKLFQRKFIRAIHAYYKAGYEMDSSYIYNIVIVDDEKWALLYLKSLFNRTDLGFTVTAGCLNPREALSLLEKERPDVLITDIRMPDISGLELIEYARLMDIPCEVVIISGFTEFPYAQQAISLGVIEYIVKPVTAKNASEVLQKVRKRIEEKRKPRRMPEEDMPESNDVFYSLLQYIEKHFDQRLYLRDLSKKFGLTPNYCCNLFSKVKSMTFSQYVTNLRMNKASMLLKYPDLSINKIALMVGFDDYTYFEKVFKRVFQHTPTEFRLNCLKPEDSEHSERNR
jgi:YesN/AraC family two-component response regulator